MRLYFFFILIFLVICASVYFTVHNIFLKKIPVTHLTQSQPSCLPKFTKCKIESLIAVARECCANHNYNQAIISLKKAITLDSKNGKAHSNLGICYLLNAEKEKSIGNKENATHCFQKSEEHLNYALEQSKNDIHALSHRGIVRYKQNKLQQAQADFQRVLSLDPDHIDALQFTASIFKDLKQYDKSISLYHQLLQKAPNNSLVHEGIRKAYEARGAHQLEQYLKISRNFSEKIILMRTSDWGFGDAFQLIRFAKYLKERGATILVIPDPPVLKPLLSLCPFIDDIISLSELPPCDFYLSMQKLPELLEPYVKPMNYNHYIFAQELLIKQWRNHPQLDNNDFKIGICWEGETKFHRRRCINLEQLISIKIPGTGISLYSLQKGAGLNQINQLKAPLVHFFDNFDDIHGSFMDTAALMKNLDLVVTVDTSIAHLAGALGVPVWVMLPHDPEWRWKKNPQTSLWAPNYPTMKIFKQNQPGNWITVLQQIKKELLVILEKREPKEYHC